jgi:hypothetical protein
MLETEKVSWRPWLGFFEDFFLKKRKYYKFFLFWAFVLFSILLLGTEVELGPSRKKLEKDVQIGFGTFDEKREDIRISPFYRRGRFLIYDCEKGHFACVIRENFDECKKRRKKAIIWGKVKLPCAPLKTFKVRKECEKIHYKKLYQKLPKKICHYRKRSGIK